MSANVPFYNSNEVPHRPVRHTTPKYHSLDVLRPIVHVHVYIPLNHVKLEGNIQAHAPRRHRIEPGIEPPEPPYRCLYRILHINAVWWLECLGGPRDPCSRQNRRKPKDSRGVLSPKRLCKRYSSQRGPIVRTT
jgi:hypothetical protein